MAFLLRGQWQVGLFCYVVSNKLTCFVMWSVMRWTIRGNLVSLLRDLWKGGLFLTWSVGIWPVLNFVLRKCSYFS